MIKIWSAGDIICQLVISAGTMTASRDYEKSGKLVLLVAIAMHMVILAAFTVITATWHRRALSKGTGSSALMAISTQRDLMAIYIACGLILLRSLFRFIEFASGPVSALN